MDFLTSSKNPYFLVIHIWLLRKDSVSLLYPPAINGPFFPFKFIFLIPSFPFGLPLFYHFTFPQERAYADLQACVSNYLLGDSTSSSNPKRTRRSPPTNLFLLICPVKMETAPPPNKLLKPETWESASAPRSLVLPTTTHHYSCSVSSPELQFWKFSSGTPPPGYHLHCDIQYPKLYSSSHSASFLFKPA